MISREACSWRLLSLLVVSAGLAGCSSRSLDRLADGDIDCAVREMFEACPAPRTVKPSPRVQGVQKVRVEKAPVSRSGNGEQDDESAVAAPKPSKKSKPPVKQNSPSEAGEKPMKAVSPANAKPLPPRIDMDADQNADRDFDKNDAPIYGAAPPPLKSAPARPTQPITAPAVRPPVGTSPSVGMPPPVDARPGRPNFGLPPQPRLPGTPPPPVIAPSLPSQQTPTMPPLPPLGGSGSGPGATQPVIPRPTPPSAVPPVLPAPSTLPRPTPPPAVQPAPPAPFTLPRPTPPPAVQPTPPAPPPTVQPALPPPADGASGMLPGAPPLTLPTTPSSPPSQPSPPPLPMPPPPQSPAPPPDGGLSPPLPR